jgi:hypothetical protein
MLNKGGYMSLDITLTETKPVEVYSANITHNLNKMADAVGIYLCLWHPEDLKITKAKELIKPLKDGVLKLKSDPDKYIKYEPPNKWGTYKDFIFLD